MIDHLSVQDLYVELIRRTSYNSLDGPRVVESLLAHRDLWLSAIMVSRNPGILLRDLQADNNVDTLYVLTTREKAYQLAFVACSEWNADEITHFTVDEELGKFLGCSTHTVEDKALVTAWWH